MTKKNGTKLLLFPTFTLAYAGVLGLGLCSLLNLLSLVMYVSIDGKEAYPRFVPFCIVLGVICLIALAFLFVLNLKLSEKLKYGKALWIIQFVCVLLLSLPMVELWQMLFDHLQKTF